MRLYRPEDVRFALRRLGRHPWTTLAAVFALGCGIAAAAVAWSLLTAVVLRPIAADAPERLFSVQRPFTGLTGTARRTPHHHYQSYRQIRGSGAFAAIAAGGTRTALVREQGGAARERTVYFASHDFFSTLGIGLSRGRGFRPDDDRRGASPVAILSDRYWRVAFNADPAAIGRTLLVANQPATIVGVAPRGFRGIDLTEPPDLYLPLHTIAEVTGSPANYFAQPLESLAVRMSPVAWIEVVGRLAPGQTAAQAEARLARGGPVALVGINTAAVPESVRPGMSRFTALLSVTVALLFLAGSATVGLLLLVRTEDRHSELAVSLALGATRWGLVRSMAVEAALCAGAGAVIAVPIGVILTGGLAGFQLPGQVDVELLELAIRPQAWSALAAAGIAVTTCIAMIAGACSLSGSAANVLHIRGGATATLRRRRARNVLVIGQLAVTLVLVLGAGLFARSLITALALNPGIDSDRIVTGGVFLDRASYTPERAGEFFAELQRRLARDPSVRSLSLSRSPGGMAAGGVVTIDGVGRKLPGALAHTEIGPRYFSTMGLRLLAGRDFSPADTADAPLVAIVSESYGRFLANGGSPLGHRLTESSWRPPNPPAVAEVIGVVPDVIRNVSVSQPLVTYYAAAQRPASLGATLVIRAAGEPGAAIRAVLGTLREMDPVVVPGPMQTIREQLAAQMNPQQFGVQVLGTLGGMSLLLSILGTYVLAASMAAARQREMSIRAALGATRVQIGSMVLREMALLAGAGIALGVGLAWVGANSIRTLLYRIEPFDPGTVTTVSGVVLSCALLATVRPALHLARGDMLKGLRELPLDSR